MSFIAKHITHHDERLIYIARLHWIYLMKGFTWFFLLAGMGIWVNWLYLTSVETLPSAALPFIIYPYSLLIDFIIGLIPSLLGFFILWVHLFKVMGTEIALTNKRLITKSGVFFVQSSEVELSEIMEEQVDNALLGALLDYGTIHFDCRFVGDFSLPIISHPYRLLRQMNKLRTASHSDEKPIIP